MTNELHENPYMVTVTRAWDVSGGEYRAGMPMYDTHQVTVPREIADDWLNNEWRKYAIAEAERVTGKTGWGC